MDLTLATPLLGGLSPAVFMRRHWQKKPLLIRQALPGGWPGIDRAALFGMAASDDVESRLIVREGDRWKLRHGPFAKRAIPSPKRTGWTLLVQGVDLHLPAAHELLGRFRFVPDARLDDLMVSYASGGGGVGPHVDSYDVFLLQASGRRRWRIGRARDRQLVDGLPLKILANFEPEQEWLLDAGDMLYLPPGWAHDGVADGECLTCSIGFRAPSRDGLGRELLQCVLDAPEPPGEQRLYRDPKQPAVDAPARIPSTLQSFASDSVASLLADPLALACALGELLSEPKPGVEFDAGGVLCAGAGVVLDRRSRMLYDEAHVFLNGEAFRAAGRDARLIRQLADERTLAARDLRGLSAGARELVEQWADAGWLHAAPEA